MKVIAFTKSSLPYGWMGNMSRCELVFGGLKWTSTEAIFQALRFADASIREQIRTAKNGFAAKIVAKQHAKSYTIQPCSRHDLWNMAMVCRAKINQHENLKKELLDTGDALIVEDITKRYNQGNNNFWGAALIDGEWVGENNLGKVWMEIRDWHLNQSIQNTPNQQNLLARP